MTDYSLEQPSTSVTKTWTQERLSAPVVIDGAVQHWPTGRWTVHSLADTLGAKTFRCRLMPLEREAKGVPAWEAEGVYVNCQLRQFLSWCQGEASPDNPLAPFSPLQFSAYIDYKYMTQMFAETPHMLKEVQWGSLGLENLDGESSTIWIGSHGASTPCHYDTYGFNLVAQIQGRKRWVLIPPEAGRCMYPTRVPYEESSVFSQLDLECPDLDKFPEFKKVRPVVVTLEPGQVLYVPRHWWHYVTCTQTAISVNTWVDVPEDRTSRLQEAVTRVLASSLIPYLAHTAEPSTEDAWINPTEDLEPAAVNMEYLKAALLSWQPATYKPPCSEVKTGNQSPPNPAQEQELSQQSASGEKRVKPTNLNSSPSTPERPMRDCEKHSDLNKARQDIRQRESFDHECSGSGDSTTKTVAAETADLRDLTGSKQLMQLARALQYCPLKCVQSPFCLSECKNKEAGSGASDVPHPWCESEKQNTENPTDTPPGKRKCSDSGNTASLENNTSFEPSHKLKKQQNENLADTSSTERKDSGDTTSLEGKIGLELSHKVKEQQNKNMADASSRKRKHSGDTVLTEDNTGSDPSLRGASLPSSVVKQDAQCVDDTATLRSDGEGRTHAAVSQQSVPNLPPADLSMSVYVPQPCSLEQYLQMMECNDCTEESCSKKDAEDGEFVQGTGRDEEHSTEAECEKDISHTRQQEHFEEVMKENDISNTKKNEEHITLHCAEEKTTSSSHVEGYDSRNVPEEKASKDCDCLEEKLLRSLLHPDVVELVVQKLMDQF